MQGARKGQICSGLGPPTSGEGVSWKLGGGGQSVATWVPSVLPLTWSQSCPWGARPTERPGAERGGSLQLIGSPLTLLATLFLQQDQNFPGAGGVLTSPASAGRLFPGRRPRPRDCNGGACGLPVFSLLPQPGITGLRPAAENTRPAFRAAREEEVVGTPRSLGAPPGCPGCPPSPPPGGTSSSSCWALRHRPPPGKCTACSPGPEHARSASKLKR